MTSMAPGSKGWCPHCCAELAIPVDSSNLVVQCPNCARKVAVGAVLDSCRLSRGMSWRVWASIAGLAVLALGVLAYRFRGHISSAFGSLAEATGGKTVAALILALALFLVVCLVFWMTFPILVYFGLRNLNRQTARLHQTAQLSLQHLALLTAPRDISKAESPPEQKSAETAQPKM